MFRQTLRFSSSSYIIIPGMKVCTGRSFSDESEVVLCSTVFQDLLPQPVFLIVSNVGKRNSRAPVICFQTRDTRVNLSLASSYL